MNAPTARRMIRSTAPVLWFFGSFGRQKQRGRVVKNHKNACKFFCKFFAKRYCKIEKDMLLYSSAVDRQMK